MRSALPILTAVCGTILAILAKSMHELDNLTLVDCPDPAQVRTDLRSNHAKTHVESNR